MLDVLPQAGHFDLIAPFADAWRTSERRVHPGEVAERVQDNVIEAVERMLGLEVAEVHVFVSSIAFT